MEQENSGKKDNLKKLTNIFETDFRNFLFHSTLNQNFPQNFGQMEHAQWLPSKGVQGYTSLRYVLQFVSSLLWVLE